jgi:hypothetical protein
MVDAEAYVFNLDSALVIGSVLLKLPRDTRLSSDTLVAVEEHRYRLL